MSLNKLFTYGTLCSGFNNPTAAALHQDSNFLGEAQIKGHLYLINQTYPGLVQTDEDTTWIKGEVWELLDPVSTLERLDEYEGCANNSTQPFEYQRVEREVKMKNALIKAWVYLYRLPVHSAHEIKSGVFKK